MKLWKKTLISAICLCFLFSVGIFSIQAKAEESKYFIKVNKGTCVTTVYKKDGTPYKAFISSPGNPTPEGTFYTSTKYRWHELVGNCFGQYCTRITDDGVLFHSVYYYVNGDPSTVCTREYNFLGVLRSLGCIRLTVQDAKWVYENCESPTKVIIFNGTEKDDPLGKPSSIRIDGSVRTGWDPTDPDPKNPYKKYRPTIKISKSKTIQCGSKFNIKEGVTAKNYNGKNYTKKIQVEGTVNSKKVGTYLVTYCVTSSKGITLYKDVLFKVVDKQKPKITGAKNKNVTYLTTVNVKSKVKAYASSGKSLTKKIKITAKAPNGKKVKVTNGKFQIKQLGTYRVTYKVTGPNKMTQKETIQLTVQDKRFTLQALSTTLEYGVDFDPASNVILKNYTGKKLSFAKYGSYTGTVDTQKLGTYQLTYTAAAKDYTRVKKKFSIKVVNRLAPLITGVDTTTMKRFPVNANGSYALLQGVKAETATGVDLNKNLTLTIVNTTTNTTVAANDNKLSLAVPGIYEVTYSVTVPVTGGKTTVKKACIEVYEPVQEEQE